MTDALLKPSPWDEAAFGFAAWELSEYSAAALRAADATPGHQTIKLDPLADKGALQQHGFYYTDTLLETAATPAQLRALPPQRDLAALSIAREFDPAQALAICHGAFAHGRFHRDFQIERQAAERRYDNWLRQLIAAGRVYGLFADGVLAGFIGYSGKMLMLHAVAPQYRGKGYAKYWWRLAIDDLFTQGHAEITSSISAANLAVLNLYASLGFSFRHPQDIYHRLVK